MPASRICRLRPLDAGACFPAIGTLRRHCLAPRTRLCSGPRHGRSLVQLVHLSGRAIPHDGALDGLRRFDGHWACWRRLLVGDGQPAALDDGGLWGVCGELWRGRACGAATCSGDGKEELGGCGACGRRRGRVIGGRTVGHGLQVSVTSQRLSHGLTLCECHLHLPLLRITRKRQSRQRDQGCQSDHPFVSHCHSHAQSTVGTSRVSGAGAERLVNAFRPELKYRTPTVTSTLRALTVTRWGHTRRLEYTRRALYGTLPT